MPPGLGMKFCGRLLILGSHSCRASESVRFVLSLEGLVFHETHAYLGPLPAQVDERMIAPYGPYAWIPRLHHRTGATE